MRGSDKSTANVHSTSQSARVTFYMYHAALCRTTHFTAVDVGEYGQGQGQVQWRCHHDALCGDCRDAIRSAVVRDGQRKTKDDEKKRRKEGSVLAPGPRSLAAVAAGMRPTYLS